MDRFISFPVCFGPVKTMQLTGQFTLKQHFFFPSKEYSSMYLSQLHPVLRWLLFFSFFYLLVWCACMHACVHVYVHACMS